MIFSIAMGADYQFYVKFIATRVPTFLGYTISVLACVTWHRLGLNRIAKKVHEKITLLLG